MKVTVKTRENRDGVGMTDITIKDLTDGKLMALFSLLNRGETTLQQEVGEQIRTVILEESLEKVI